MPKSVTQCLTGLRSNCAGSKDAPVGAVAIVGAEGTEGREELRALLASERARRMMAEQRLADTTVPPSRPRHSQCAPLYMFVLSSSGWSDIQI